jgi:hypothetical protein
MSDRLTHLEATVEELRQALQSHVGVDNANQTQAVKAYRRALRN